MRLTMGSFSGMRQKSEGKKQEKQSQPAEITEEEEWGERPREEEKRAMIRLLIFNILSRLLQTHSDEDMRTLNHSYLLQTIQIYLTSPQRHYSNFNLSAFKAYSNQ